MRQPFHTTTGITHYFGKLCLFLFHYFDSYNLFWPPVANPLYHRSLEIFPILLHPCTHEQLPIYPFPSHVYNSQPPETLLLSMSVTVLAFIDNKKKKFVFLYLTFFTLRCYLQLHPLCYLSLISI